MLRTIALAAFTVTAIAGSAEAAVVSIQGCSGGAGEGLTTCVQGANVANFDSGATPAGYSGSATVLGGSLPGKSAAPAGDTSDYLTVAISSTAPSVSSPAVETIALGTVDNYLGLYWGSIDKYNTIEFLKGGVVVDTVTGGQVLAPGTKAGDQAAAGSNEYVNVLVSSGFDTVRLITTGYNLEVDNVATANVPEPASISLLGVGLLGLFLRRKRS